MVPLHELPLWASVLVSSALVFGFLGGGFWLGRRRAHLESGKEAGPVGAAAGACLGLLAFLLAFTFSMAASRLDSRKALVLEESNAIGTAWLRADFLDDARRDAAKRLLETYVDVRLSVKHAADVGAALERSEAIQAQLWTIVVEAQDSPLIRPFADAINEVIDVHTKRVVFGMQYHIPTQIWLVFFLVAVMAMTSLGYMFGLAGSFRYPVSFALAVAFSAVIYLIADIDRPSEGYVVVDLQPLRDVRDGFHRTRPNQSMMNG